MIIQSFICINFFHLLHQQKVIFYSHWVVACEVIKIFNELQNLEDFDFFFSQIITWVSLYYIYMVRRISSWIKFTHGNVTVVGGAG